METKVLAAQAVGGTIMTPTQRQRVLAQIRHEETGAVPYTLDFEDGVKERLDAYYGSPAWSTRLDNAIVRVGPAYTVDATKQPTFVDAYGSVWRTDLRPFHLVEPALAATPLERYRFPPVDDILTLAWEQAARREIAKQRDRFLALNVGSGLWETAWNLRGFENALMDAAGEPESFGALIAAIADHHMALVERLVTFPVDGIMFADDWGYQRGVLLGPERWRRFLKPHLARLYERVHGAGKLVLSHCCGSVADIMPDIIEVGLDVLQSVQPEAQGMNPYQLKRRFGKRITFWGCLGSQSLIPLGTPAEIHSEVKRLCRVMSKGGGFVLSPAKALQPETPTENAAAVVEAFLEQAGERLRPASVDGATL
jgi:uroporphyrinogen decarboxylase